MKTCIPSYAERPKAELMRKKEVVYLERIDFLHNQPVWDPIRKSGHAHQLIFLRIPVMQKI